MSLTVRPLADDELPAAWELGRLAFGGPVAAPARALRAVDGVLRLGAFDGRGRLVGKATDTGHEQWWGGRALATADVGGVAVLPEYRSAGVARALLTGLLARGRERGAAVSALHPTVSAVYRRLGWEVVGALQRADLDTAALPSAPVPGVSVRPGEPADLAVVDALYGTLARPRAGLLTRRGGAFDLPHEGRWPDGVDGLTVAEQDGVPTGVLVYERGTGYGPEARLTVHDLLAVTDQAARALVGVLAGWRTVTRTVRLPLLAGDAVSGVLPLERSPEGPRAAFMHRPVDVVRAVADRGWPGHVRGRVAFTLLDPVVTENTGPWELELADGAGELRRPRREPGLTLDVRGFAQLYCGITTGRAAALAGLVSGPDDPAALDLLASGPPVQLLDYF
ncbi:GNAT family N-acetyltransferase [Geodermatophilus poikilotrophus]|uniref:Predicted acetyltransferase n=1 Tax=Geodermatophilus poikilotrophus TaxID=1333667 RepID=A0A1I0GGY1_9ACTN|nr:GNAT family N-acetyltransferase [Geodermatophilus poikilotrophus]SET69390.1 Predicted acetyltransferase [Geodermatophilus poikilotrophus]